MAPLNPLCAALVAAAAIVVSKDAMSADVSSADALGSVLVFDRAAPPPLAAAAGLGVGHEFSLGGVIDDDYATLLAGVGATVWTQGRSTVAVWGELGRAIDLGGEHVGADDYTLGAAGPAFRIRLDPRHAVGAHVMLDLGAADGGDDLLASVNLGFEYEATFDPTAQGSLRLGVNGYAPFEGYGDASSLGTLDRAPRLGADVYARLGRDLGGAWDGARLDLTVAGFGYAAEDGVDALLGGRASLGLTVWGGLPEGVAVSVEAGPRYANGGDGDLGGDDAIDVFGGAQVTYSFGGDRAAARRVVTPRAVAPGRDCVLVRNRDGESYYDCAEPVRSGVGGGFTKEGEPILETLPAPAPLVTLHEEVVPGIRPSKPLRHLGYGGAFTPLNR